MLCGRPGHSNAIEGDSGPAPRRETRPGASSPVSQPALRGITAFKRAQHLERSPYRPPAGRHSTRGAPVLTSSATARSAVTLTRIGTARTLSRLHLQPRPDSPWIANAALPRMLRRDAHRQSLLSLLRLGASSPSHRAVHPGRGRGPPRARRGRDPGGSGTLRIPGRSRRRTVRASAARLLGHPDSSRSSGEGARRRPGTSHEGAPRGCRPPLVPGRRRTECASTRSVPSVGGPGRIGPGGPAAVLPRTTLHSRHPPLGSLSDRRPAREGRDGGGLPRG